MDSRYDPHTGGGRLAGPWSPQPGTGGQPPNDVPADDSLVRLAGWISAFSVVGFLTTVALLTGGLVYVVATWRRWRWWPVAVAGAAGLLLVLAVSGPGGALHRHLLAMRELTEPGRPVGALVAARWPPWALAQIPLGLPLGALLAALGRHQVTHIAAHELSPRARRRRDAEDQAQLAAATRRATNAPPAANDKPVLGAWAAGDLHTWRAGRWCVIPDGALGLGTLLIGLPGAGKTETLLRLAQLGLGSGFDVHVIDAKGDPTTQARFSALAASMGQKAKNFPQEAYDGFRGDPEALRNRFARIVDYTEPYYQDGARVLLAAACTSPLRGLEELIGRLGTAGDVDQAVRKGTLSRYRSFATAAGGLLSGSWAFEDTRASYLLLDGLALGDDTPRLARYLIEDFTHYCAARKPPDRKVLLLVDEFSALRLGNAAALFERLRSFNAGVVLAAQSIEGLHDDEAERQRLLNAASTLIAHRLADPDPIVTRAGTIRRAERSHQLDDTGPTGAGSLRIQDTYRVDPNDLRSLPTGIAWIVTGGWAAKVAVATSRGGRAPLAGSPRRGRRGSRAVGPGDPALVRPDFGEDGPGGLEPLDEPAEDGAKQAPTGAVGEGSAETPSARASEGAAAETPIPIRSPYAQGL